MNVMYYILIGVIILVVAIDFYVKNKKKKSDSTDVDFPLKKENSSNVLIISIGSLLVVLLAGFFVADYYYYEGRLSNNEDQFSIIEIIKYNKFNKTQCNGRLFDNDGLTINDKISLTYFDYNKVKLVGDSIYQQKESNTYVNGIVFCSYGNIGKVIYGKPDGLFTLYHTNGQKKMQVRLVNGKQEGFREDWYSDGQKEFEGYYLNDKQTGLSKFWFQNGQLELEGEFDKGKFSGSYKRYYKDGQLRYEYDANEEKYIEYWKNGKIYCESQNAYPNSPLIYITGYTRGAGARIQTTFYDENSGEIINSSTNKFFKKRAINRYSGRDCWFSAKSTLSYDSENCDFYSYYLNGSVQQKFVGVENNSYDYFENGILKSSSTVSGVYFDRIGYNRNGKITSNIRNYLKTYDDVYRYFYDEHGIENENRLFVKNKELYF